jgi:hypothetical protein
MYFYCLTNGLARVVRIESDGAPFVTPRTVELRDAQDRLYDATRAVAARRCARRMARPAD